MTVSASEIRNIARHNGHGPAAGREQLVAILAKSTLRVRKPRRNKKENEAVPLPLSQSPTYTCGVDTPFIHAASSLLLVVTLPRLIPTRLMPHSRVPSATSTSQPTLRASLHA